MELELTCQTPLNWPSLLGFLGARATPGVESVDCDLYRRTISLEGTVGTIEVSDVTGGHGLLVRSRGLPASAAAVLEKRVRRLFDVDADSLAIAEHLARDPHLAPTVREFPGIRIPGSWTPFETAVRAIVGQVVSVRVATAFIGRLVGRHGGTFDSGDEVLTRLYPSPERLAESDLSGLGLSGQKIASITALARSVASGTLCFDALGSLEEAIERLQELPGIGPWTAHYIAMRALGHADAFPAGDLILRRAAAADVSRPPSEKELTLMAERWRPYRAYAAMLLWASYSRRMEQRKAGRQDT